MLLSILIYFLYCGTKNCTQHSRWGHNSTKCGRKITSFDWLALLCLVHLLNHVKPTVNQHPQVTFFTELEIIVLAKYMPKKWFRILNGQVSVGKVNGLQVLSEIWESLLKYPVWGRCMQILDLGERIVASIARTGNLKAVLEEIVSWEDHRKGPVCTGEVGSVKVEMVWGFCLSSLVWGRNSRRTEEF